MANKEQYFTTENFREEVSNLVLEIRTNISRDRKFEIIGRPALLVTDMQDYFLSPGSHAYVPSSEAIIPGILKLIKSFDDEGHIVIFTRHGNSEDNAFNMGKWWKNIMEKDSTGYQISSKLSSPGRKIIEKTQYDAFYMTGLHEFLISEKISTLIICGLMTNLCCETSLRSAFVRGYNAILPVDACATYKRDYHISTFNNLAFGYCPVRTIDDIIKLLHR
jgi:nicotinamidase-related amidase